MENLSLEEFTKKIHQKAVSFRNKKRKEAFEGNLSEGDVWIFKRMEEIFKNE